MFKKLSLLIAAALLASPAYAGKLAVPGANDLSGNVVISQGLLNALQGVTGSFTYTPTQQVINNLLALALRLPGTEGDPNAGESSPGGRFIILHNVSVVDSKGQTIVVDIKIDRVTREVTITRVS